jgi:DnaJ-class molecular chaperone
MAKKRCQRCAGSGKVMGGGMMMQECDNCEGIGKLFVSENEIDFLTMKQTDSYQQAKGKLKAADTSITDEKAEELLDKAMTEAKTEALAYVKKSKGSK